MDRNLWWGVRKAVGSLSLSARRAWIEILMSWKRSNYGRVALRKESVDRNSLGAVTAKGFADVALRKESVDRNVIGDVMGKALAGRSPQGERG